MRLRPVDTSPVTREWGGLPLYRAEFWTGRDAPSRAMETWDVERDQLGEVLAWCREHAASLAPCKVVLRFARPSPPPLLPEGLITQVIHTEAVTASA